MTVHDGRRYGIHHLLRGASRESIVNAIPSSIPQPYRPPTLPPAPPLACPLLSQAGRVTPASFTC
ncbi:hypothetical protein E2C01_096828 [Portunus trituberculatus]|uniref:Uncharacterized protein n=1 Tax=Portunus trituberculatus TaxID=210409 RepID=A0A5B7K7V8_PORTR|nr:hypothetical protein [Portunus trituberculatus]